jgi:hypothetical protein
MFIIAIIALIISAIVYFGFGWIVLNIYYSIYPISGDAQITSIYSTELLVYACIASAFSFICSAAMDKESDTRTWSALGIPFASWLLFAKILPMSVGGSLLNTIICIISMTVFASKFADEKF